MSTSLIAVLHLADIEGKRC